MNLFYGIILIFLGTATAIPLCPDVNTVYDNANSTQLKDLRCLCSNRDESVVVHCLFQTDLGDLKEIIKSLDSENRSVSNVSAEG